MRTAAALEFSNIHKQIRGQGVLTGLTLQVPAGACHALVGLNGSGKTTALRILLGMLQADSGTASIAGHDVIDGTRSSWAAVGHLVETPFCYPELTARDNVLMSADLHGADPDQASAELTHLAEILRFTQWLHTPARRLSLGTRQKIGLAAALAHQPRVVVLDEPTNGLDPLAVVGLRTVLQQHVREGGAVLVTSHHFDELARIADAVHVLHGGRVIDTFTPRDGDLERRFFETVLATDVAGVSR